MVAGPKLVTHGLLSARHARWLAGDVIVCCVAAKASLQFATSGVMRLVDPNPLVLADQLQPGIPEAIAALLHADEMVPVRKRADVLLHGTAFAPPDRPQDHIEVRLAVGGPHHWVIDKRLSVKLPKDAPAQGTPLHYAFAAHSVDNPAGVSDEPSITATDSDIGDTSVIGVAPIAPRWPQRARLLTPAMRRALAGGHYPWGLDERFFQSAPPDQQLRYLRGNERILLQGVNATAFEIGMTLPRLAIDALLWRADAANSEALAMVADTLVIDADALRCDIVWRAQLVMTASELDDSRVEVTLRSIEATPKQRITTAKGRPSNVRRNNLQPMTMAFPLLRSAATPLPWQPFSASSSSSRSLPTSSSTASAAAVAVKRPSATTISGTLKLVDLHASSYGTLPDWLAASIATPAAAKSEDTRDFEDAHDTDDTFVTVDTCDTISDPLAALSSERQTDVFDTMRTTRSASLPDRLAPSPLPRTGPRIPLQIEWPQYAADSFTHPLGAGRYQLVVAVKARAQLLTAEPATWLQPAVPLRGDVSEDGVRIYASDYVPFKPQCDVTVVGTKIGNTWESYCNVGDEASGMHRELRRRSSQQWCAADGGPASFGPRQGPSPEGLGASDERWRADHVPAQPADDVWQAAPAEQRMAPARGDESYSLEGLSDAPLHGTLPARRAVCFIQRSSGELEQVPLLLDTIAFDAAEQHVTLVWRGHIEVADDEARDVAELFVSDSAVGDEGPPRTSQRRWRRR